MSAPSPLHHAPDSLRGHFLIATPVIGSGFFNRSLTYLCEHNSEGAMGIVVNQCLEVSLTELYGIAGFALLTLVCLYRSFASLRATPDSDTQVGDA